MKPDMKRDKKRPTRLYNLIFPVWVILSPLILPLSAMIPPFLVICVIVLVGNFIIDFLVVWLALRLLRITDAWHQAKRVILKVWIFGFIADTIGALLMLGASTVCQKLPQEGIMQGFYHALMYRPFAHPLALLYTVACILLTGALIYCFNSIFCLQKAGLADRTRRCVALALAVITAPWTFLLPYTIF